MRALPVIVAVGALVALTASVEAQMINGMVESGMKGDPERRQGGAAPPHEKHAPRSNEKDYKSSLGRLPDKKYDPWANTR
jgi:hypothetical protein